MHAFRAPHQISGPYFERQVGNNCRVHALNALFNRNVIDEHRLKELDTQFHAHYGDVMPAGTAEHFDYVQSDTLMLVSFILERRCKYVTHYVPIGYAKREHLAADFGQYDKLEDVFDPTIAACLCFSRDHIWAVRKHGGEWYNLDSLFARPRRISTVQDAFDGGQHGVILIYSRLEARTRLLPLYQRRVCKAVREVNLTRDTVKQWLQQVTTRRELGGLQPALCNFYRVYTAVSDTPDGSVVRMYNTMCASFSVSLPETAQPVVLPLVEFVINYQC